MLRFIAAAAAVFALAGFMVLFSTLSDDGGTVVEIDGASAERGRGLMDSYGCGSCHTVPGIESTDKYIGPPLDDFAERRYVAGDEPNVPEVLIRWIMDPQSIEPGTVMPDLGVSRDDARDIAAYLYSNP